MLDEAKVLEACKSCVYPVRQIPCPVEKMLEPEYWLSSTLHLPQGWTARKVYSRKEEASVGWVMVHESGRRLYSAAPNSDEPCVMLGGPYHTNLRWCYSGLLVENRVYTDWTSAVDALLEKEG